MDKEEKNRKIGLLVSGLFHMFLLLAFLFIIAWKEPDPPIPQYGIELNFGLDDVGSGEVQPETPVEQTPVEEDAAPEEVPEETEEVIEETETVEESTESTPETTETTDNTQESPDVVEKTPEVKEEVVEQPQEQQQATQKQVEETQSETPQDGAQGNEGESSEVQNSNQGDNNDKEGDKGDEQGTLDSRALYGEAGGGGGPALDIVGWNWDQVPNEKDQSSENGQVVIDFWIDEDGFVVRTRIIQTGVSMSVAKFYESQLRETTFSKTSSGTVTKPQTKGTVTFSIKSK